MCPRLPGYCDYGTLCPTIKGLAAARVDTIRMGFPWVQHTAGEADQYGTLCKKEYSKAVKTIQRLQRLFPALAVRAQDAKPYDHCFAMTQGLTVGPDGRVYTCPEVSTPVFGQRYSYGSVYKTPLSALWHSAVHQSLFRRLDPRGEKCECCPFDGELNRTCAQYWPPRLGPGMR